MRYAQGSALGLAFALLLAVAAGATAALAPVAGAGLVLGGSACGGGGEEQVCRGLARQLTLVEVGDAAWLWVAGGAACVGLGVAALLVAADGWRVAAAAGVLTLAFAALVTTTQIDVKLGPEAGGTYSRSDDDWGEYLAPALRDFRADALRRYEGRRERAGAPPFEREQILASYSVRAQDGWRLLRLATVALFFASLFEVARCATRRPSLAAVVAATCGGVIWALIHDRSFECAPDSSECYRGLTTLLAFAAAGLAWAAYGLGVALGRLRLRPPRPPRPPT